MVPRTKGASCGASKVDFVITPFGESDTEGVDRREALGHEGHDGAAVGAAAQVGARAFRGTIFELRMNRRANRFPHKLRPGLRAAAANLVVGGIPKLRLAKAAVLKEQHLSWKETLDAFEGTQWAGHDTEEQVLNHCLGVHFRLGTARRGDSAGARRKKDALPVARPVECLQTHVVDEQEKPPLTHIPQANRKRAAEIVDEIQAARQV